MATTDEIYAIAAVFSPVQEGGAQDALPALCAAAEAELTARLRPGIGPEDCRESFLCAAAMMAAAALLSGGMGAVSAFSVGSVSVQTGSAARTAADLRTQAALLMRPFCRGGFSFAGVLG